MSKEITRKRRKGLTRRRKDLIFYIVTLAIPIIQFLIFYVGVNFNSVLLSFQTYNETTSTFGGFTLKNFGAFFSDLTTKSVFKYAFKNSLIAYLAGLIFGTGFSLIFSYYIYKKYPMGGLMKVVLFIPSIISGVVLVTVFSQFVNNVIPEFWQKLTGHEIDGLINNRETRFWTVLFYCVWISFGGSILLYVGAMNNISESVIEAGKIDGANTVQEIIHIILPLIYPTIVTFMVVAVGGIFTNQLALYSFFAGGAENEVKTFGYYLYVRTITADRADYPQLAAIGLLMTLIMAPLTMFVKWLLEKIGPSQE